jgi:hypothetical protein
MFYAPNQFPQNAAAANAGANAAQNGNQQANGQQQLPAG